MTRHGACLGVLVAAAGCGGPALPPLPSVDGPRAPLEQARTLLERLRTREEETRSWKAVHTLSLEDRAQGRRARLRGVLLVRRPDRFRLRLLGPAGTTAMDLVWVADHYRLDVAGRAPVRDGSAAENHLPVAAMARAFLRSWEGAPVEMRSSGGLRRLLLRTREGTRVVVVDRETLDVIVESQRDGHGESLRVEYGDYRQVQGARVPFRVRMDLPRREITARVRVERWEPDPDVPPQAWEL